MSIPFKDFSKFDLRVAEVISAERVAGTDKLLKLEVDIGDEKRQLVAGIAEKYSPEWVRGKKIVVVCNLEPATIRGVTSEGMLLAASTQEHLSLIMPCDDVPAGTKVQ